MTVRNTETWLAKLTLWLLVVYFPVETLISWPALWSPYYLIDLIAMLLLLWGARLSLRARPRSAPGALSAAYAWTAANGWRASFDRLYELAEGGQLDYGAAELCFVVCGTVLTLGCFGLSLWLVVRSSSFGDSHGAPSA